MNIEKGLELILRVCNETKVPAEDKIDFIATIVNFLLKPSKELKNNRWISVFENIEIEIEQPFKIFRDEFKNNDSFEYYLKILNIKEELWPEIHLIIINFGTNVFDIYDKDLNAVFDTNDK